MKKISILIITLITTNFITIGPAFSQWETVLTDVVPAGIYISPESGNNPTLFMIDNGQILWRSTDQGDAWSRVLVSDNPSDPQLLRMAISSDFRNDSTAFVIRTNGEVLKTEDAGTTWLPIETMPGSVTGIACRPGSRASGLTYALTALGGPGNLFVSDDNGTTWNLLCNLTSQTDGYPGLFLPDNPETEGMIAVLSEKSLLISANEGLNFFDAFDQLSGQGLSDFAFSPFFSDDSTVYLSDSKNVWISKHGGKPGTWVPSVVQTEPLPIRLDISSYLQEQKVIYATSSGNIVKRSFNDGQTWEDFGEPLNMEISCIALTNEARYSIFLGIRNDAFTSGKLLRSGGINGLDLQQADSRVHCYPNPATDAGTLQFNIGKPGLFVLNLFDAQGRPVLQKNLGFLNSGSHSTVLHFTGQLTAGGIYIGRLQSGEETLAFKIAVR